MYQEDDRVQTRRRQADTAIRLAMANRWEEAVAVNKSILGLFPNDADSHNRLGKALMELGRFTEARRAYKKALELDPTNSIARKNLQRLPALIKSGDQSDAAHVDPTLFIEEMGKTTVTTLQGAAPAVLTKLNAGDRVELVRHDKAIQVETARGDVVGVIEPKLTLRLLKLLDSGNEYAAGITNLDKDACRIIIKETVQHPSMAGRPSFPTAIATESMRPYTKGRLLRHETNADEPELDERERDAASDDEDGDDGWDDDKVVQEGHIRLNDAAAAEEREDDEDMDG